MRTLHGTLLKSTSPSDSQATPHVRVSFGEDGVIAEVAQAQSTPDEFEGNWILPGFIDAHLHVSQWDRRGIDGYGLFDWFEKVGFPAEERLADPKAAEALAEEFVDGMFENGTTCVSAFGTPYASEINATFEVFARRGLRATYGMTLNDMEMPESLMQNADDALETSRQLAAKWHGAQGGLLRYAFSPRASIRCTEKLMRGAAALADMLKCSLQTHVAESPDEMAEVRQRFPEQLDEVDIFEEMGIIGPRTLLAHGVLLDHQQRHKLAKSGSSLVHCPTANLFRESGLMDLAAHRSPRVKIALGSGIAGGFEPFMPRVAADSLLTAKAIKVHSLPRRSSAGMSPSEAWWMLTAGGAAALGLEKQIGTIAPGYIADCLVVKPEKWLRELPSELQTSALLYTLKPSQIKQVYVAGKLVRSNL